MIDRAGYIHCFGFLTMQVGANQSSKHEKKRQAALHEQIMFHVQGSMQEVGVVATRVLM